MELFGKIIPTTRRENDMAEKENTKENNEPLPNVATYIPDDEEYSYRGYEQTTQPEGLEQATYIPDDEEYSYRTAYNEAAATQSTSYGDFIVEQFSTESFAPKFSRFTKLSPNLTSYIFCAVYLIFGVISIVFTAQVTNAFQYIVGGIMVAYGAIKLIVGLIRKDLLKNPNEIISSVIFVALGIMIMAEDYEWAMMFISVVWGIFGLLEGAHAFKRAIENIMEGQPRVYYLLKGCIELILAFLLLHDFEHLSVHIIVFGIQLIFDGITMLPQVRRIRHYF
jgi:uncharacterized membrane protein HdeD (DUF308 family)